MPQPALYITEKAVVALTEAAARAHPLETGGVLIGVYVDGDPWVCVAVEIASSNRGPAHYRIPAGVTQAVVNTAREEDSRLGYLGDWHTHPADVDPSTTDLASLVQVSLKHPTQPNPTSVVVRRTADGYRLDARRITRVRPRICQITQTGDLPTLVAAMKEPDMPTPHDFDPTGPAFISYRQSDGTEICAELAWILRAAGIPVWRDRDDLPPGDTTDRLHEALSAGLSAAVLVVTPDLKDSTVVQEVESPRLIALHRGDPAFALGIANAVERAPGKLDYTAPDRLLKKDEGTLGGVDQAAATRTGLLAVARKLVLQRIANRRDAVSSTGGVFALSLQSRNTPQVYDRTGAELDIRVRPPEQDRLPSGAGLRDLADVIHLLPTAVTRSAAQIVRISGGAHLCVAFSVGAALPSTRVGTIEVVDQRGIVWSSGAEAHQPDTAQLAEAGRGLNSNARVDGRMRVGVYLDLLPSRSDAAFESYLDQHHDELSAWLHLRGASDALLDPTRSADLAAEIAHAIRTLSNAHGNAAVDLLLRCPFPVAVLVGRLTNTLRVTTYEWDDSGDHPRYVATLRVRAAADGVIEEVLI